MDVTQFCPKKLAYQFVKKVDDEAPPTHPSSPPTANYEKTNLMHVVVIWVFSDLEATSTIAGPFATISR